MSFEYDCAGWATRSGIRCSDGRTILPGAFKDDIKNGKVVPIVWQHNHDDPRMVLGHALLENRKDGVYAYCKFNNSELGTVAKNRVHDRDITQFSIWANKLKQTSNKEVLHGVIRELSVVLSGANPEAVIDQPFVLVHSDDPDDTTCDDAYIFAGQEMSNIDFTHGEITKGFDYSEPAKDEFIEYPFDSVEDISHAEDSKDDDDSGKEESKSEKTIGEIWDTFTDKQKKLAMVIAAYNLSNKELAHSDTVKSDDSDEPDNGDTVQDIYDSLNDEQKEVLNIVVGTIIEESKKNEKGAESDMKHSVWDTDPTVEKDVENETLAHSAEDILVAMEDAKEIGSMRKSFLQHGITNIDYLYPEDHNLNTPPAFIKRPDGWVSKVLNGVHHTPFSKVKSQFANITGDEARARGYIKGDKKENEVFTLLRRSVGPTTIYKHQEMDRDDMIDITEFDVVAWLKLEMRGMLDEEIARAILVSDGRLSSSRVKIPEDKIIPIWKDDPDLFTIPARFTVGANDTEDDVVKKFIRAAIKARKYYRGSGQPTLFTTEDLLTDILLLTDNIGRDIYEDESKIAKKLRVKEIVTVPVMENLTRSVTINETAVTCTLRGIIVNLSDYNVGADKGGAVNMFDDFDIDYNKQKYLIETRISGALTVPFSAIIIESYPAATSTPNNEEETPSEP